MYASVCVRAWLRACVRVCVRPLVRASARAGMGGWVVGWICFTFDSYFGFGYFVEIYRVPKRITYMYEPNIIFHLFIMR